MDGRMTYDINRGGPVTDWKDDVGQGWHSLLDELHAELVQAAPDYKTLQVKEKFAALTVYVSPHSEEIRAILDKYYARSTTVCEQCGEPGETRHSRFWLKTLCDACEHARMVKSRQEGSLCGASPATAPSTATAWR